MVENSVRDAILPTTMSEATEGGERDYVIRNRGAWNEWATDFVPPGERSWASEEPFWGIWQIPEAELGVLPHDLEGKDTVEARLRHGVRLGLARTSRRASRRHRPLAGATDVGPPLPAGARPLVLLNEGNAEELPFPDASFDLAISEYGASIWADPYRWIPEASRVLRPGGELIFLVNGTLALLCSPDSGDAPTDMLHRHYFGMHRFEWPDWPSVEFHLGYGDMIRLLRANGFVIEDLLELRPAPDATPFMQDDDMPSLEWSLRWPCEEVWKARKNA